ncbi:MAG: spore coat protein U domain-containing protein [Methylococcales bacterium]|nr:spore coat protein U domain-containing protein [Methylococcales bacterium]
MKKIFFTLFGASLLMTSLHANAEQSNTTLSPSLKITSSCSVDTSGIVGTFTRQAAGSTNGNIPMQGGLLKVNCLNQPYLVGANAGVNSNAGGTAAGLIGRRLNFGNTYIPYELTVDIFGGELWGDHELSQIDPSYITTLLEGMSISSDMPSNVSGEYQITGRIPHSLSGNEPAGPYGDTVTVTIVW